MFQDNRNAHPVTFSMTLYLHRLSAALKAHRSISRLARLTNINRATLRKYRDGQSSPNMQRLQRIADATGLPIEWFLLGTTPKKNSTPESL